MDASDAPGSMPTSADDACLRCGAPLGSLGVEQFRVGGTTGGWKLFLGEWAELGEDMIALELFGCDSCGHVELRRPWFDPEAAADEG